MKTRMTKKQIESLKEQTLRKQKLVWDELSQKDINACYDLAQGYKNFLNHAKTEREAVRTIVKKVKDNGFVNLDESESEGDRVFKVYKNKCVALAVMGSAPLEEGARIIAAHTDSPRLDLKQNPLYEQEELAFLKTHYYGGIRKHHWLAIPLAIHGRVIKADGSVLDLIIGEEDSDPIFTVSDLLPHLARKVQGEKKLSEAFEAEKLNVLVGSLPVGDKEVEDRFKLAVLQYLNEKHGMVEEDLTCAEIEVVPAGMARDIGFDRSMIGAYGQDDRISVFCGLEAILKVKEPEKTVVALFFDKEEIGSDGNTGAKSRLVEDFIARLLLKTDRDHLENRLRNTLINSVGLSADVNAALDPDYQDVHEKRNAARLGHGVCITKFTGSGGKYGSSDASAEYLAHIRKIFNDNDVIWQTGELGKIDEGGGGTIAKFLAVYGMDILDCGPVLLSMHSPLEISSKADLYMTRKAYEVFFNHA